MTDTEKRELKKATLLDFHEAVENLKAQLAKARRLSESLDYLSRWVTRACSADFDPHAEFSAKDRFVNILADESRYREAMNYDALLVFVAQIGPAQKRVEELRAVKQSLGLN